MKNQDLKSKLKHLESKREESVAILLALLWEIEFKDGHLLSLMEEAKRIIDEFNEEKDAEG